MAKWRPTVSRQQLFPDNPNALNSEYYGQRMGMIMDSGAGRFFEQDPSSLVNLASSSLSNDDMLETLFMANDQVSLNTLRQQFENLPPMTKKAEFNRLPPKTQNLLLASGLKLPKQEEDESFFKRVFTWDNPLLPEEFLRDKGVIADSVAGTAFKGLLAPVSAVGFVLGKAASTLWEWGAEKPNRFAKRVGRSLAHMDETNDAFIWGKPARWRDAWNKTLIEDNSFTDDAVDKSIELIGVEGTTMLRAYLSGGVAEVEQRLIDRGEAEGWSEERVSQEFYRWQRESDGAAHVKAKEILESHRLDGFNYSIRAYNKYNLGLVPDVTPDSWQGKTVGFTGAMATEILLDPLMWGGGVFSKIFRRAKAGIRGGGSYEQIHFWQRMTEVENAAAHLKTANGRITPEYTRAFKEGLNEYAGEVAEWTASNSGLATLNATNLNIRIQARAQNRMINRVNEAFDALNALDDEMIAIRNQRAADGLEPLNRWELEQAAVQNTGKNDLLYQLSRDFPGIDPVIDDMRNWHAYQRDKVFLHTDDADVFKVSDSLSSVLKEGDEILGANGERIVVDAAMLEKMDRRLFMRAPDLSTREGYWAFLQDAPGRKALTTSFGGTDPGAMWLPRIGAAGARWVEGKRYMRKILDFGAKTPEVDEDMARLAANYIAGQTDYVAARVAEDIANEVITLSRVVDEDALARIINQGDSQIQSSLAEQLGLTVDDMTKIQKSVDEAMKDAPNIILEDGYLDPLLRWYQDQGFVEVKGKLRPARTPIDVPLSGAARAARNHFYDQLHAVGSLNGEVSWATRVGMRGKSAFTFLAYHPARWAEKLTTYTPKQAHIDVLSKDAISDFKSLIDMGLMANVPRVQLDNYLRMFITGNEAQRWWVQTQFTLDFLGRSGALTQGGRDVQDFIKRFIQHGNAHYSALQNDFVGVYEGLGLKRAILGSAAHDAQLSRMNVIPNYRELAAVSKYMAFYRMAGWGIHLPAIDKFLARTWRPAVLLRLGYVARNGGEELFSWWLREGPKHWAHQKAARKAQGSVVVWDEYGRKVVRPVEDLGEEAYEAMLWKPVSRLWRSFNEVAGIGDFAITAKAIKKAAEEQGPRWAFLSADERMRVFEKARSEELRRVELNPFSKVGRGAFELGNAMARSYAKRMSEFGEWLGMPTRRELARHFLERTDPDHELRIFLSGYALTNPTILDEQMKNILGTFDTYTNFEKNAMSSAMRREGLGSTVPELLKLPIDYTRTAMKWVTNAGADANQGTKAIAMAQYLSKLPDDIGSRAMLAELAHYVSEVQDASLKPIAERLVASLSSAEQARFRGTVGRAARTEPFDPGLLKFETSIASSELEEVAEPVVVMVTGSRFVPKNRAPLPKAEIDRIKQAIRDSLNALPDGSTVRVGGAAGVDQYAEKIVLDMQKAGRDIKLERYYVPKTGPESWSRGGRAGPIRNRRMLEGRPHDAPDTPPRGNADVVFAFHPGKGMGPQTPTVSVSGLTGRGAKALTSGLGHQAHTKYFSRKLVVPFAEWARLSPGGVQNPGAIIEVTSVRGDRIRLRVIAREIITDKNNFHEVNPFDMHLSKNPQRVLQSMVAQKAAKGTRQLDEPIRIKRGKNLEIEQIDDVLSPEEANRLISYDVEVIKPDALTAADRATRASGQRIGSGTEDAMQAAFSAGVYVDDGARLGRPEIISKGAQRASHYRRLRVGALDEGHFVDESVEGGQTVMRVYKAGTQTDERFIPAVEAVPALSASATVITLLREADPKVLRKLREAFDTSASQNTRLAVVWEDALDEVLDFLPREQREIWLDLFRPRYSGPVDPADAALPGRLLRSAEAGPVGEPFGLTQPTLDVYGRSFSTVDDLPSGYKNELTVKSDPETGEALYTNAFARLDDAGQPVVYMNLAQIEKHYPKYGTDRPFERYRLWEAGLGIDSAFVRENLEPGGLIRITAQDLTNPDEFLRIANEHLGEGVLALDSPLEGYLGHAALTWEHEMAHVRLGHPYARKHLGDDFDSSKEAWRARELDVDSEVFRRLGIDERQLNPDPSRVRLHSVPVEDVADTPVVKKTLQMSFVYGETPYVSKLGRGAHVTSDNTFDAIVAGERTATTRGVKNGRGELEDVEVGDIIQFQRGGRGPKGLDSVSVRVTGKRQSKDVTPEEWARVEGYAAPPPDTTWDSPWPGKKFAKQRQITFEVVDEPGSVTGVGSGVSKAGQRRIEYVDRYTPAMVTSNPDKIFIFSDNLAKTGTGPKSGQAVIRNAGEGYGVQVFGIPTKVSPSKFMTDEALEANKRAIDDAFDAIPRDGRTVVLPKDGLGTGRARLAEKAPETNAYLQERLQAFIDESAPVARAADDVPAATAGAINVRGSDDVLSNFHNAPLEFRGHTFQTAEGAYQAFKSVDGDYKPGFENLTGAAAKQRGKKIETDKSITEDLMREILAARHAQQPEFREALRATGSSRITHHVPGRPDFWNTQGKDTFARLLTELRDSSAVVPEPVRRGIDVNLAGFLLSDANPTRLTDDFDEIARRLQDAYVTALSTPEGQQQAHSMARSVLGGDPSSPTISHALPESHLRIFMPFIPIALLDDLNEVITGLRAVSPESAMFKQEFERILQAKAEVLGITEPLGEKVGRLLNPASAPGVGIGDNAYTQMALHWRDSGEQFMPLVVGSADDRIATIISEALLEAVARRRGVSVESLGAARIASRDIHADEFFNDFGRAARERTANASQPTVSHRRAGLEVEIDGARRANQPETFGTTYYGMTESGVEPASAFGAGGLKNEQVFGVVPEKLVPTVDGAKGVEMVNGKPLTRRLSVYKHKRGERPSTVVRTGDHRKAEWYGDGSDWELVSEHVTTGNDLRNFVEGQAVANSLELVHHMSNVSRGGSPEVFFPWIREALGGDIDAGRIQELTDLSGWWSKAPSNILAFVPVSDDAGNAINKGWNSLLRNWFDGVVNPMIGAMVREPLFHHYLLEGWKQTADVKMLYRHAPGRYDNLKAAFGRQAVFEEGQQLVVTPFESFIKFDWSMAAANPKDVFSRVAFALDDNNPKRLVSALDDVLKIDDLGKPVHDLSRTQREFFGTLRELAETGGDDIQDFFGWAKGRKISFETHRDHALQRAMTLSSAYIDDHRIRSQFQQMVGTMVPFWFAEDQFLRRMGRSIKHNPMMLRRLNLTMSAGVHGGLIQEDQYGSKVLVYPGSEMATTAMLEFTDRFPIINRFFGGPLGSVVKSNLTTNINVIPGYNLEQVGQMGFGPILSVPINYIGNRDPMLRKSYERNMVGGRYTPDQTGQILLQSVLPAVIARPVMLALGEGGFEASAIVKAQQDIIRLRALNGQLPTPQEIAAQPNPELFMEQFMDEVAEQARQYLLLQSMSWFLGPATAKLSQLTTDPAWEWNKEFYDILDAGVPWEEAYESWQNRIIAEEGSFDPFKYSPFRVSPTSKSTFAVLESTQDANVWLTHNKGFITNYPHTSAFFMPRGFESDDDEYSAEARARQHAYGLRYYDTPREYLENLYYQNAMPTYMRARKDYQSKRYYSRSLGLSTDQMDREWDVTEQMFFTSNPIFAKRFQSGESRELRTKTVDELELLVADPSQIPDGPHKEDLILAANHILLLDRTMRDLSGLRSADAQNSRESARMSAYEGMRRLIVGRPWLNEIYYSVFLPILGDTWIARYEAGLIGV